MIDDKYRKARDSVDRMAQVLGVGDEDRRGNNRDNRIEHFSPVTHAPPPVEESATKTASSLVRQSLAEMRDRLDVMRREKEQVEASLRQFEDRD